MKKDPKKEDGGHGVSTKVAKDATEAAIVDTIQGLCMGEAAFGEVKAGKDNLNLAMVDNKESDKVKVVKNESNQVKVVKKKLNQIKAVGKDRVSKEICDVFQG